MGISVHILFSLLFFCLVPSAYAGDVYSISNIEVEATASSAVHARQAAILEGHAIALQQLLERITLPEDWTRLPRLAGKEAQLLAIGYTMAAERNSATHYIGKMSVRFVAPRVRTLLQKNNIPFGDVQVSPILVIPVYDLPNGRRIVWDNQNIWRQAWGRPDISDSLTPFILPVGDIDDIVALPARTASLKNRDALFWLAKRYRVKRVLLAYAKLEQVRWRNEKGYALVVKLNVLTENQPGLDEQMSFSLSGKKNPKKLVESGVDNILHMTSIAWKRRIIVHHNEIGEREVEVEFNSLVEWRKINNLLSHVSVLNKYQVRRINNQSALLTFTYSGSKEILALALKQKNIKLVFPENEEEAWQIKLQK